MFGAVGSSECLPGCLLDGTVERAGLRRSVVLPGTNVNERNLRHSALPSAIRLPEWSTRRFSICVGVMMSLLSRSSCLSAPGKASTFRTTASRYPWGLPHTKPIEYYAIVSPARSSSGGSCEAERGAIGQVQVLGASAVAAWLDLVGRV
jgi:hypothetical protein